MVLARGFGGALRSAACLVVVAAAGCANGSGAIVLGNPFGGSASPALREKAEISRKELANPGQTHLAYARLQESWGNLDEARGSYQLVLGEDPRSIDATLGLARIDQLSGRTTEAEQGFLKALRASPGDPAVLAALGEFHASRQNWREAVRHLHEATVAAPNDAGYRHHLAIALARSGNVDQARPHFARAVGDAEAHYNIGYILFDEGNLDDAERELRQAVVMKPELRQARQLLDQVAREREQQVIHAGGTRRGGGSAGHSGFRR
ncbi:MAG: tetratricopeptide repeat protein [Planctomycetaceae bacterium]